MFTSNNQKLNIIGGIIFLNGQTLLFQTAMSID